MSNVLRANLPLALKYRPQKLDDLAGHESVVGRLKGIIKTKNIPNSILMSGPSGCGKTTTARILARTLSCEKLTGCGKCRSCVSFDAGQHPDYTEINAADQRGIDDMRALLQKAKMMPQLGPLRIFMLDECQMLSPQSQQCFVAGTLVKTPSGYTPIESLLEEDTIIGFDVENKLQFEAKVEATKESTREILHMELENGQILECTPDHLFHTQRGWVEAQHLTPEDDLTEYTA